MPYKARAMLKRFFSLFTLESHQSPLFFHGILCFLWRLADFIPGRLGIACRGFVGRLRFKKLGRHAHIDAHNTFFDGRETEIGDNFYAGQFNYFAGGPIKIGNDVRIANDVIIETTAHYFDDLETPIYRQGSYRLPVSIGNNVWIGDRATILGGVAVGDGAIIGAGAVVTRDVPPNAVVAGNPARVLRMRGKSNSPKANEHRPRLK